MGHESHHAGVDRLGFGEERLDYVVNVAYALIFGFKVQEFHLAAEAIAVGL